MSDPLTQLVGLAIARRVLRVLLGALLGVVTRALTQLVVLGGALVMIGALSPTTVTDLLAAGVRWLVRLVTAG